MFTVTEVVPIFTAGEHVRLQGFGHPLLCLLTIYILTPLWYHVCSNNPPFIQSPHIRFLVPEQISGTPLQIFLYFNTVKQISLAPVSNKILPLPPKRRLSPTTWGIWWACICTISAWANMLSKMSEDRSELSTCYHINKISICKSVVHLWR